jgi:outer membrane protein assembly factor BamE
LRPVMRKTFFRSDRSTAAAGALLLAGGLCLGGCTSKNPLIDGDAKAAVPASSAPAGQATDGVHVSEAPSGISRLLSRLTPYRVDVQQGNFISREMVDQLKESMKHKEGVTREQVRFALGTPLLTDMFHADRWDYYFRLKKGRGELISSRVTVFFNDNRLVRIEGDQLPTEKEYLAYIAGTGPAPQSAK